MSTTALLRAIELGLIFSILSLGEYITVKVMDSPDLTVDGSFVTGGCVGAVIALSGHPILGLIAAFFAGMLCGCVTAFLQTKMKIHGLLAGILTMTALYTVNIRILGGKPNVPLIQTGPNPVSIFADSNMILPILILLSLGTAGLLYLFFKTNLGLRLRACGDNEEMVRSSSINTDRTKFLGLSLSNGLVAFSGAVMVQFLNFADVTSGTGMLVLGLAGIMVGEAIFRRHTIGFGLCACIAGAIIYRLIYAFALQLGFAATDMNMVSAVLVAIAISAPRLRKAGGKKNA